MIEVNDVLVVEWAGKDFEVVVATEVSDGFVYFHKDGINGSEPITSFVDFQWWDNLFLPGGSQVAVQEELLNYVRVDDIREAMFLLREERLPTKFAIHEGFELLYTWDRLMGRYLITKHVPGTVASQLAAGYHLEELEIE